MFNTTNHYGSDKACPLDWEPSGFDFLSPCLQEADLLGRISAQDECAEFDVWFNTFLPQFQDEKFVLQPGSLRADQCDQMTRLCFQYLAIYSNEHLPKSIQIVPK